ncbi:universal stress protein [Dellaglioa sp. BT-FLS60]
MNNRLEKLDFDITPVTFERVLVAIDEDDSESSILAFNYAVALTKLQQVPLGIVSILETNDMNIFDSMSPDVIKKKKQLLEESIERYVDKARDFGVENVHAIVSAGRPGPEIVENIIPDFKPDILICGSKTNVPSNSKKIFIGSQASYMAQNAQCSVSVIR